MSDRVVVIHQNDTAIPVAAEPGSLVVVKEPADTIVVRDNPTVATIPARQPDVVSVTEQRSVIAIASPAQGPAGVGPQGEPGQPRWTGQGPPGVVIGAAPGDEYLDNLTGDIYRLS